MRRFFNPAIALMNRLGYTRKFALLGLITVGAIAVLAGSLYSSLNQEIRSSQRELEGIALIKPIFRTVQAIQQHRGMWIAFAGDKAAAGQFSAKDSDAAVAFNTMEATLPSSLKASKLWQTIKADWEQLEKQEASLTPADSFAAHTRLIGQIQDLGKMVSDEYALTQDPQIDTYHLIDTTINRLPDVLEHLGQVRAYGSSILKASQISEEQKIDLYGIIAELESDLSRVRDNFEKTGRLNPALQSVLLAMSRDIADSAQSIVRIVRADIISGRFTMQPADFFAASTASMDWSYAQMYDQLLPTAERLLKIRIAHAENALRTSIAIAALLLLVLAYFVVGIYYAIMDSIQSLGRSSQAFAGGDLRERVHLNTHDELRRVGDSFNKMADGFCALIEARRHVEDDLRESEEKLRAIFEGSNDAIMLFAEGRFIDCNRRALEMFGLASMEEFTVCHLADLSPPFQPDGRESRYAANERIRHALEHGTNHFEWMHRRKNGEEFPADVLLSAFDYRGERIVQGTVRDISERKESGELKSFKFAMDQHAIVSIADVRGIITYVNDKLCEISGYQRDELIGQNHRILNSGVHDAAFFANMWETISGGRVWHGEVCNRSKGGAEYWVDSTIVPFVDDQGLPYQYISIRTDITRIKQIEGSLANSKAELEVRVRERTADLERSRQAIEQDFREMQRLNQQLQEAQDHLMQSEKMASIGQLAAGVAHEINNPIGYVSSNLGTLEKYVDDVVGMLDSYEQAEGAIADEELRSRLQAARKKLDIAFLKDDLHALLSESKDGIVRVKQIVQNLKDFSHADASDEWIFADLHKGLDSTLNIVNNEIKYKASVIREYGDIPEVECLASQLNQVFMNLLVNAAHAIEERGTITIRTGRQGDEAWVEVADTGKGIAPEHMQKIFDPFFTTKPIGKGTGLGLSLSYGIVQKHRGRIEVQSEVGKGTAFRVWLPVRQVAGDEA